MPAKVVDCLFGEASKRRQGAAMMKSVFSAVAILAAASMLCPAAKAQNYSWCAQYTARSEARGIAALSVSSNAWRPLPELADSACAIRYTKLRPDRIDDVIIRIEKTARSITIWVRAFATPAEAFGKLGVTDFALWRALRASNPCFQ
jgi:hypothetical protein